MAAVMVGRSGVGGAGGRGRNLPPGFLSLKEENRQKVTKKTTPSRGSSEPKMFPMPKPSRQRDTRFVHNFAAAQAPFFAQLQQSCRMAPWLNETSIPTLLLCNGSGPRVSGSRRTTF